MASDKHTKSINASEVTYFGSSFSGNNASDETRSIAGHSVILSSDETRSLASYSHIHGSDETSSIATLSFRSQAIGSDDERSITPNAFIDESDETRSIASYSQIRGSDETSTLASLSLRSNISQIYGSDETRSEASFSLGSDETRSQIHGIDITRLDGACSLSHTSNISQIYGSDETRSEASFSLGSDETRSQIHGKDITRLDDACSSSHTSNISQIYGSDETRSEASFSLGSDETGSQIHGKDITRLDDACSSSHTSNISQIYGSDETRSEASFSLGSDETRSQIHGKDITRLDDACSSSHTSNISQIYGSDETRSEASFSLGSDETRSQIHRKDITRLDDACSSSHTSGITVSSLRAKDVAGSTKQQENTKADKGIDKSHDGEVEGAQSKHWYRYSVTGSRDIDVRIDGDTKTCWIYDICQLPDGRMLMSDFNNSTLKLLDQSYTVIDHCDMPGSPEVVCWCDKEACVGQWSRKTLQFVSIQEKMEISRTMEIDHDCIGLAYRGGKLYVSDGRANIHVYNKAGNQLRVYNIDIVEDDGCREEYLTVSMDGRHIYMTNDEYLICMDRQSGGVIWRVKAYNDSQYNGVCVDKDNNVLVCDGVYREIVQYSGDGEKLGVIVDGLKQPRSICLDQESKELLVGMFDSNVIERLNLKIKQFC